MDTPSPEFASLRELAKRRHVHYDVSPEVAYRGGVRVTVGFDLRIWAVHDKGAHALPGCPKCLALASELSTLVRAVLPEAGRPTIAQVEPLEPALADSAAVPGADEIEVVVRLIHRNGYDTPVDACEERCLREIRQRLRDLGVPER